MLFRSEWRTMSLPSGRGIYIFDSHTSQPYSSGHNGTALEIGFSDILAGAPQTKQFWLTAPSYGSGASMYLYNWAPNFGGWQRTIIHFRGGSADQNPIIEMWIANGTGSYTKLSPSPTPYNDAPGGAGTAWPNTSPWGDPLSGGGKSGRDYLKDEIYALYTTNLGGQGALNIDSSLLFAQRGINLYDMAVAALAPYAR